MRKFIILLVFGFLISNYTWANKISLEEIRKEFYEITINSKNTPFLLEKLYAYPKPDALILGYTAATEAMMAKVVWNPYSKFNYLFKSKDTFAKAIDRNSSNVEIRFLRFAVEHHLPKYLGLSKNMQSDMNVIIHELNSSSVLQMNNEMLDYTMQFLIESNKCTEEELLKIRTLLSEISNIQ